MGGSARRVHPAAGASVDSGAWAGRDAGHSDDRQKAKDRGYRLATGRGFQLEEGRDCRSAKDVAAAESEHRVARKRQPQAGRSLADPAVVGRARRDAVRAQRQDYFVQPGVKAVRAGPEALASAGRTAVEPAEGRPEQADVGPLRLQGETLREPQQASALRERPVQSVAPVSAERLERKRLAMEAQESPELVEEWRPVQAQPALRPLVAQQPRQAVEQ
jgi:hypothetical protein